MKPWGLAHSGCCKFRRLKKKTETKLKEELILKNLSVTEDDLKIRIMELENFKSFLEKNIVEASLYTSLFDSIKTQIVTEGNNSPNAKSNDSSEEEGKVEDENSSLKITST